MLNRSFVPPHTMPSLCILIYVQHLSGTGHYVRMHQIAQALAREHRVLLASGGRKVPRASSEFAFQVLELPRIRREGERLVPCVPGASLSGVMRERLEMLHKAVEFARPERIVIEHFPFSKWELQDEIVSLIAHARRMNPESQIVCSLRDIVPATRFEPDPGRHRDYVLRVLDEYFDAVMVHSDPRFIRLEDYLDWAGSIDLPLAYTGFVSEKPKRPPSNGDGGGSCGGDEFERRRAPTVIVSAGGKDGCRLVETCIAAWKLLRNDDRFAPGRMLVFLPLAVAAGEFRAMQDAHQSDNLQIREFTPHFLDWLRPAALSISQAGYNTCTNILEAGTPAVLVPNPMMSDQKMRASRLAELGLARMIEAADLDAPRLARTMCEVTQDRIANPPARHSIDLHGADQAAIWMRELANHRCNSSTANTGR